jgi:hypothetical protein
LRIFGHFREQTADLLLESRQNHFTWHKPEDFSYSSDSLIGHFLTGFFLIGYNNGVNLTTKPGWQI